PRHAAPLLVSTPTRPHAPCRLTLPPPAPSATYTLSLHDALPIWPPPSPRPIHAPDEPTPGDPARPKPPHQPQRPRSGWVAWRRRSEEHTSELQSHLNLVCRLLLEKKKFARRHRRCYCFPDALAQR